MHNTITSHPVAHITRAPQQFKIALLYPCFPRRSSNHAGSSQLHRYSWGEFNADSEASLFIYPLHGLLVYLLTWCGELCIIKTNAYYKHAQWVNLRVCRRTQAGTTACKTGSSTSKQWGSSQTAALDCGPLFNLRRSVSQPSR